MQIEHTQKSVCESFGASPSPAEDWVNTGFAAQTRNQRPIHGLRHPVTGDTTGWYIWCGDWSNANDFFQPHHTIHVKEMLPEVTAFLALPPGYRFLIALDHQDVWFDEDLLTY